MARCPRIDFPGAFHHVYARGIEKRNIFQDLSDREEMLRRIRWNLKRFNAECPAWAFLPNHFHILFHSETGILSSFMRCLMSGYSIYFNKKHGRTGHLFQNRYKSSVIDTERYLLELIRYIHLNPVRSGIVGSIETLAKYPWTGHFEIMSSGKLPWTEYPFIHDFFSTSYLKEIDFYIAFLEEGLRSDPGIFLFKETEQKGTTYPGFSITSLEGEPDRDQQRFLAIVEKVSGQYSISRDRILNGQRDRISSRARREIMKQCVKENGISHRSLCRWLGITDAGGMYLLNTLESPEID